LDAKDFLIEKANIGLPSEFLKRWMLDTNKEMDVDKLNEEFAEYEKAFRWQLVRDKVIRSYEIKVSDEEVFEYARILTRNQFFQYGLYNVTDEQIDQFTRDQLSKPEESRRLREQKYDDKTIRFIKDTAGLDKKEINPEKFKELFEK
jgi:trigger factor